MAGTYYLSSHRRLSHARTYFARPRKAARVPAGCRAVLRGPVPNFKPFNDYYGYRKGDDVIQLTGRVLEAHTDPARDFVGHIGGDDFLVLFQSEDWQERCHAILAAFAAGIVGHFDAADLQRGGYMCEDRQGNRVMHPVVTLSLGIVKAEPGHFRSHLQIAAAASDAKKQAKRMPGNSLFVDRRTGPYAVPETRLTEDGVIRSA